MGWSSWRRLTPEGVEQSPDDPGVYRIALADGWHIKYDLGNSDVVYIGMSTVSIRQRLRTHVGCSGNQQVCGLLSDSEPLFYQTMRRWDPRRTESNLLHQFVAQYGDTPLGNMRLPAARR